MSLSRELTIPKNGCGQAKWHKKVEQNGTKLVKQNAPKRVEMAASEGLRCFLDG